MCAPMIHAILVHCGADGKDWTEAATGSWTSKLYNAIEDQASAIVCQYRPGRSRVYRVDIG